MYLVLALTFGFTLLATELAIGRKTRSGALYAYSKLKKNFGFLGVIACLIPLIILAGGTKTVNHHMVHRILNPEDAARYETPLLHWG